MCVRGKAFGLYWQHRYSHVNKNCSRECELKMKCILSLERVIHFFYDSSLIILF